MSDFTNTPLLEELINSIILSPTKRSNKFTRLDNASNFIKANLN
jgi:hypothetical protein